MEDAASSTVVVIDDDPSLCAIVGRWLETAGYQTRSFGDGPEAIAGLATVLPDAILLDVHLPGQDGLAVLEEIKQKHRRVPVLMMTAETDVSTVVSAMRLGAYDYLTKPLDKTKLLTATRNALDRYRMELRLAQLEREVEGGDYPGIIGRSPAMKALFREIDRVAASDITVLIHGESGTGKELVARAIHDGSGRREGPFVAVNCAAIPETLLESELFGHEKGSFTGATARRVGRFEQAHRGTLFLDEIGELGAAIQAKLLRAIETRRFHRLGSADEVSSDFRLLAATHRDLALEARENRFRQDLYFRIAIFELELPALRKRGEDVVLLAERFVAELGGDPPKKLSDEVRDLLRGYDWPGNVRELQNAIHRGVVATASETVRPTDLPARLRRSTPPAAAAEVTTETQPTAPVAPATNPATSTAAAPNGEGPVMTIEELEKQAILDAYDRTNGNVAEMVRQLGIGRTTLYRKLKKLGLG